MKKQKNSIEQYAQYIREWIIRSTSAAGSGHPSSSLSAVDLLATLFAGKFFRADLKRPHYPSNDRLIFSKGHAAPLLYALYAACGAVTEKELLTLRKKNSPLEGHPSLHFPFTEAPTGSLGQGLSIGVGMALAARMDTLSYRTFVLLGDSEMSEGQVWEAMALASQYTLKNLIAIIDVNRLGQRGETMHGYNTSAYEKKCRAFGWQTVVIDGHRIPSITKAFQRAQKATRPFAIIAKTIKGRGFSLMENKNGWHGKALTHAQLHQALEEIGSSKKVSPIQLTKPALLAIKKVQAKKILQPRYAPTIPTATRAAYGAALIRLKNQYPNLVVLDAEVSNSTFADIFQKKYPRSFFEMFIAEQNMISVGVGLSRRGKLPFISSFAAFLTRGFDQIRMAQYAETPLVVCGSHAGVSIGEDGFSQMALEDIAMFRALLQSTVLYPSDAIACERLCELAAKNRGITYIRTTRGKTPILYASKERFTVGGSKTLRSSRKDVATVIAAGITVHEALRAYEELKKQNKYIRVIDAYSIKPIDAQAIQQAVKTTKRIIVVEDHGQHGGLADAVREVITGNPCTCISLAVKNIPHSATPEQALTYAHIDAKAIRRVVLRLVS